MLKFDDNLIPKIKVIKELLEQNKDIKPELACYTPVLNENIILGNGTQLYKLEDTDLPFKVCFTKEYNASKRMKYLSKKCYEILSFFHMLSLCLQLFGQFLRKFLNGCKH